MKIYTSYFANVKKLPDNVVPISICGMAPDWWEGYQYKKLAPKKWFFDIWKETQDNEYYIRNFKECVLNKLNCADVLMDLGSYAYSAKCKDIALICYETPDKFCHRHLVADWIKENCPDLEVEEYMES